MFTEGIVLGHHISGDGIKIEKSKVEVISKFLFMFNVLPGKISIVELPNSSTE